MKNYTITVNGNVYDVTVEEGTSTGASPVARPVAAVPKAQAPAPAAPATASGATKVTAPVGGKILAVKVSSGQAVAKGDVVAVLEAMKMENEVVAPEAGTVASVNVSVGDMVESGAVIVSLN